MTTRLAALLEPEAERQTAAQRLETAIDLARLGEELVRARLRRQDPQASEAQVEAGVRAWWAEKLDEPVPAWARVVSWPRR